MLAKEEGVGCVEKGGKKRKNTALITYWYSSDIWCALFFRKTANRRIPQKAFGSEHGALWEDANLGSERGVLWEDANLEGYRRHKWQVARPPRQQHTGRAGSLEAADDSEHGEHHE